MCWHIKSIRGLELSWPNQSQTHPKDLPANKLSKQQRRRRRSQAERAMAAQPIPWRAIPSTSIHPSIHLAIQPAVHPSSCPVNQSVKQKWGANKGKKKQQQRQNINNDIKLREFHSCWLCCSLQHLLTRPGSGRKRERETDRERKEQRDVQRDRKSEVEHLLLRQVLLISFLYTYYAQLIAL